MKFTARRQSKKATITVSKQTVEDALQSAQGLSEGWKQQNENDPRLEELKDATDFLTSILSKNPREMTADGVSSIEEYFDDAIRPDIADRVKGAVDMILSWRRESHPAQMQPQVQGAPMMASAKKADGGAAFSTDRDEKGEAKLPEKSEVPRLAAKGKKAQDPAVAAPIPAAAPVAAPIPVDGSFDIKTLSSEALAKAIKALTSIKEFESDKSAQALIEAMANELKTRPIEQEDAPAAAPAPAPAPIAAPVVASAKKAEDAAQAQVSLGGLNTAPSEGGGDVTASMEKEAVTPPGIGEDMMHKLKDEYPNEPDKAYATAWSIHNKASKVFEEAGFKQASGANSGGWFVSYKPMEVDEDGGRTPEIGEAHSKLEDHTGINHPATTMPIKLNDQQSLKTAADMTSSKAVKEAQRLGEELKRLYLGAKPLTGVNDTRPVREAVEAIFRAADLFEEATKVLTKHNMQVEQEEAAAKIKEDNKGKKSAFLGLSMAAAE